MCYLKNIIKNINQHIISKSMSQLISIHVIIVSMSCHHFSFKINVVITNVKSFIK